MKKAGRRRRRRRLGRRTLHPSRRRCSIFSSPRRSTRACCPWRSPTRAFARSDSSRRPRPSRCSHRTRAQEPEALRGRRHWVAPQRCRRLVARAAVRHGRAGRGVGDGRCPGCGVRRARARSWNTTRESRRRSSGARSSRVRGLTSFLALCVSPSLALIGKLSVALTVSATASACGTISRRALGPEQRVPAVPPDGRLARANDPDASARGDGE